MKKRENESYLSEVLSKLTEHKMAMVGLFVITLEIILVVVLPFIMHLNPYDSDYTAFSAAPSGLHIPARMPSGAISLPDWFTEAGPPFW